MIYMISQPMANLSREQILAERDRVSRILQNQGHTVMNTYFEDYEKECEMRKSNNCPLFWLGKSFEAMSLCDAIYFTKGWGSARGCRIEYQAACEYGMHIVNEEDISYFAQLTNYSCETGLVGRHDSDISVDGR